MIVDSQCSIQERRTAKRIKQTIDYSCFYLSQTRCIIFLLPAGGDQVKHLFSIYLIQWNLAVCKNTENRKIYAALKILHHSRIDYADIQNY